MAVTLVLLTMSPAVAEGAGFTFGGDTFAAGQSASAGGNVTRDAFIAGFDVKLDGPVGGDAHMAGFNVTADSPVAGDLYAAGFNVSVSQPIGGDLSAMGNNLTIERGATVGGSARLGGANATVSGQISGAALVAADTLNLDAAIEGDFEFFGNKIEFGPDARVDGTVKIHAPAPIDVPSTVASADRVTFEVLESTDYAGQAGKTAEHVVRGVWPAVWATGLWWVSLAVIGFLIIALLPRATAAMEDSAKSRPLATLGIGLLGFAAALGIVPVTALTIIGIVLLPVAIVVAIASCILAYLAGVYLVGFRASHAFMKVDTIWKRAGVLVASVVLAGLIGMLPLLGWLISLLLLTFGFGVVVRSLARRTGMSRSGSAPEATRASL